MDLDDHLNFDHLFLYERKCRVCGQTKNLIGEFYRTRKDRGPVSSSFSYECKECTKKRIVMSRKPHIREVKWEYPDW
jgi:predicted nucleic acid-binding Zn ribbon protein